MILRVSEDDLGIGSMHQNLLASWSASEVLQQRFEANEKFGTEM